MSENKPRLALSAQRALETISFLTVNANSSFTLSELSKALNVSLASMSAVLGALTEHGFLVRHASHKTYSLGPALVVAGQIAATSNPMIELARREMRVYADRGFECIGSIVVGQSILLVAIEGRPSFLSSDMYVGQRMPLVPPVGTVFLAWGSDAEVAVWLGYLGPDADPAVLDHLSRALAATRKRHYAITLKNEASRLMVDLVHSTASHPNDPSLRQRMLELLLPRSTDFSPATVEPPADTTVSQIAVPVFDPSGQVTLAITITGLEELEHRDVARLAMDLKGTAMTLTRQIGGREPRPRKGDVPLSLSPELLERRRASEEGQ